MGIKAGVDKLRAVWRPGADTLSELVEERHIGSSERWRNYEGFGAEGSVGAPHEPLGETWSCSVLKGQNGKGRAVWTPPETATRLVENLRVLAGLQVVDEDLGTFVALLNRHRDALVIVKACRSNIE